MSKLYFRYGAMNCGKTTVLLQVANNYEERGMKVKIMKPSIDTKGEDTIVSRIGISRKVDYLIKTEESPKEMIGEGNYSEVDNEFINYLAKSFKEGISCIIVDEAQFLSRRQVDILFIFAKKYDIPVICYGLRTDFQGNLFPGSERLFSLADEIEEVYTICRCGKKARFNARKNIFGEFTKTGEQVMIDQGDTYESLCGKCYLKKVMKLEL